MCQIMMNGTDAYTQFQVWNNIYMEAMQLSCNDVSWESMIRFLNDTSVDYGCSSTPNGCAASRQWTYQTCNQFGYYQTTYSTDQPFSSWTGVTTLPQEVRISSLN